MTERTTTLTRDEFARILEVIASHYCPEAQFDRLLEKVRAEERERIAQALVRELGDGRAADIARRGA